MIFYNSLALIIDTDDDVMDNKGRSNRGPGSNMARNIVNSSYGSFNRDDRPTPRRHRRRSCAADTIEATYGTMIFYRIHRIIIPLRCVMWTRQPKWLDTNVLG
ncbi:hypothetical protein V1478_005010 [Vespula squamosa]|uniref:Uncharacterized protein n=1 Tax=Vespula squamosa TaxID=30214 RepID=A0ABD2BFE9_VESSQ